MAARNDNLREIMAQSRVARQALFGPVAEISCRLQPAHLVDTAARHAKAKIARAVGGVSTAVKENGGTAAAIAVGAVAVFDAGRKSAERPIARGTRDQDAGLPETYRKDQHEEAIATRKLSRAATNVARSKVLSGAVGALLIGHLIGRSTPTTDKERELFGKGAGELKRAASAFGSQHAHGAKLVAAQAFGLARYSAAFLAIMGAVSDYFTRPDPDDDPVRR